MKRSVRLILVLVLTALGLAVPQSASAAPFTWDQCGGDGTILKSLSLSPSPITGSGASMFFRWDVTHDSATGDIIDTEFQMGAPLGQEGSAPLVRWHVADSRVGSATYGAPSSGVPVATGLYGLGPVTVDGLTTSWSAAVTQELNATNVTSVSLQLDRKILGVWITLPAIPQENIAGLAPYSADGDYYLKVVLTGPSGDYLCLETYFTTAEGSTAPFVLHPVAGQCAGRDVTITGDDGANELVGTKGNDVIAGLGGNDEITGGGGNDIICGGDGNDKITGSAGNDTVNGDNGDDRITGASGIDALNGGDGVDKLSGSEGNDNLTGGLGSPDSCSGDKGTDSGGDGCEKVKSIP